MPGWFDWARQFAAGITERIETGLKELLSMPAEIAPDIPPGPTTLEEIEEAMAAAEYASRFIQDIEIDEARRLARGVSPYQPLTNVARMRHWTKADPYAGPPPEGAYWSQRLVLVAPDGNVTYVDVRGSAQQALDADEVLRAAASALEDDFVNQYEGVGRSQMIRDWVVATETYVERFKPL